MNWRIVVGANSRGDPAGDAEDVFRAARDCGFTCWRWRRCSVSGRHSIDVMHDRDREGGDGVRRIRFRREALDSIQDRDDARRRWRRSWASLTRRGLQVATAGRQSIGWIYRYTDGENDYTFHVSATTNCTASAGDE